MGRCLSRVIFIYVFEPVDSAGAARFSVTAIEFPGDGIVENVFYQR